MPALRSVDGQHEDKYEDVDIYKCLTMFEERITAMKESVAIETNEKVDGTKMLATSAVEDFATLHSKKKGAADTPIKADPTLHGIDSSMYVVPVSVPCHQARLL